MTLCGTPETSTTGLWYEHSGVYAKPPMGEGHPYPESRRQVAARCLKIWYYSFSGARMAEIVLNVSQGWHNLASGTEDFGFQVEVDGRSAARL